MKVILQEITTKLTYIPSVYELELRDGNLLRAYINLILERGQELKNDSYELTKIC